MFHIASLAFRGFHCRKLDQRLELIRSATTKAGGVYLYANQRGCDGGRLYYDGAACVAMNGSLLVQVLWYDCGVMILC